MNLIFLTMLYMPDLKNRGIYTDLMRKFRNEGHNVYVVMPFERSLGRPSELKDVDGIHLLGVKTLNLQKTNVIEKGIGQILVENQYKNAIRRFFPDVKFDLILYSTPPVTFPKVIRYLKNRNHNSKTYLLLKDIFPQNAVDIEMLSKTGVKGILYRFFRRKEKSLYRLSDKIGCMSPANVEYVIRHNNEINKYKVEVAPNSVDLSVGHLEFSDGDKLKVREKYGLPIDKPIFIYGGNLGKPQGIPFLIECIDANANREDCYFVVIGTGTELPRLKEWYDNLNSNHNKNIVVMDGLPKKEYDKLVRACDVGMIFLDHRFTIPNYPSRLLSYLENKMPVICATDVNTDMGRIAEENGYGYWCESVKTEDFTSLVDKMLKSDRKAMGERGYEFLKKNYLVQNTYDAIVSHL